MDYARKLFEGLSDQDSDITGSQLAFAEQPRLLRLGRNLPIPDSDIPVSEASDQTFNMDEANLPPLQESINQHPPEVDVINDIIGHNSQVHASPDIANSRVPPSSTPGKLSRPKSCLSKLRRSKKRSVVRGDQFDLELSPERGSTQSQTHPETNRVFLGGHLQIPSAKRQKKNPLLESRPGIRNVDFASSVEGTQEYHEPGRVLRSSAVVVPKPSSKRVPRATRSAQRPNASSLKTKDPVGNKRPTKSRRLLTSDEPSVMLDEHQSHVMDQTQNNPPSGPVTDNGLHRVESNRSPALAAELDVQMKLSAFPPSPFEGPVSVVEQGPRSEANANLQPNQASPPVSQARREQSITNDGSQRFEPEDTAFPVVSASGQTEKQRRPHMREQDYHGMMEVVSPAVSDDGDTEVEDSQDETTGDTHLPEKLHEALKYAREVHAVANHVSSPRDFQGIRVLKRYNSIKKRINLWKSKNDYSHSNDLIELLHKAVEENRAILGKSNWNTTRGLKYIIQRMLPTLVRMLYISLDYYLLKTRVFQKLSCEQLKISESIARAIVDLSEKSNQTNITRPRDIISMVARIKLVRSQIDLYRRALEQAETAKSHARRQQTQRLQQQQAEDLEEQEMLKLRNWRDHWRVLHDQRLGAELEGRITLGHEKSLHLRLVPLDNPYLTEYPYWDPNYHIHMLAEGLERFAGPDVYRNIFRKYCRYGGPLSAFNVSEIVDKAVALRDQLIRLTLEDGEDVENWIQEIPDPRKPPVVVLR